MKTKSLFLALRLLRPKNPITFLCWFAIFSTGCMQLHEDDNIMEKFTIDLTTKYDDMPLKLSDLFDDIKLIRLETNINSQIRYFNGFVGEKFIISVEYEKILLFTASGRYIRTIAKKGAGPGEFSQFETWTVGENEQFFMYHDRSKNYIYKYKLESGELQNNIPFEDKGDLSKMLSINDSTLAFLPNMFSPYGYLYFYQSTTGRIFDGKEKEPLQHPGSWAGWSPIFQKGEDNTIFFQPSDSDTIFRIKGPHIEPYISLIGVKPQKTGYKTTGFYDIFLNKYKDNIFLGRIGYESIISPGFSSGKTLGSEYLIYNTKSNTINKINPLYYDNLGIELSNPSISFHQNDKIIINYQALEFKEILSDALKNSKLTDASRNRLMKIQSEIFETDNPILITGKLSR